MSKRDEFAARFGEANAALVEAAAEEHLRSRAFDHALGKGSDEFRWAVLQTISFECMSRFADSHGFTCEWADVEAWLTEPEQRQWLGGHDGDVDMLGMFVGAFDDFMPVEG